MNMYVPTDGSLNISCLLPILEHFTMFLILYKAFNVVSEMILLLYIAFDVASKMFRLYTSFDMDFFSPANNG